MANGKQGLGICDRKQYEHCGLHEKVPETGGMLPPFGCKNWRVIPAAAPPVEDGLDEKCDKIARGACSNWDAGVPHLVAKAFAAFIRLRDAEQQRVNKAEIFRLSINHLRFIKAEESNRELVEKLEGTIQTIREFEAHSNESGDPVGGCVKCLRLFDSLLKRADELRAVLAVRNERATK